MALCMHKDLYLQVRKSESNDITKGATRFSSDSKFIGTSESKIDNKTFELLVLGHLAELNNRDSVSEGFVGTFELLRLP